MMFVNIEYFQYSAIHLLMRCVKLRKNIQVILFVIGVEYQ